MSQSSARSSARGWPWQFFEISGAILLALDPDGRVSYINQKGAETLGHPVSEVLGKNWFESFLPARVRGEVVKGFCQLRAGAANAPERFENPVLCRDGSERIIAWRNAVIRAPSGRVVVALSSGEDVTEQRRAETALRESELRFRATFEQVAVGMAHVGLDARFLRLNNRLCEITGYSRAELEARTFGDITHPDDLGVDLVQAEALRTGKIPHYTMEKRYIRKDGSVVWANLTRSLVRDVRGRPEYFIAVVEDITSRKQAEALLADEELQRMALSAADAGAWRWEAATGQLSWTPEVFRIFGLNPAAGPPSFAAWLERCVHPSDRSGVARTLLKSAASVGTDFRLEFRCAHPDTGMRWVAAIGRVLRGAGPARAYGIVQDVTGRRTLQEELRRSDERLRLAMRAGDIGVWDWDVRSGEVSWSRNAAELLGLEPDANPRTLGEWRALVHPDDRKRVDAALAEALAGQTEYAIEFRMGPRDEHASWRRSHGSVIRDKSGRPLRMIGIETDASARKAEEERQHLVIGELDHRTKNLLTVVDTIARQTFPDGPERDSFTGRLGALRKAHAALLAQTDERSGLAGILAEELAAVPANRIAIKGPDVALVPRAAQMLILILHELATNAVKYGALSATTGTIAVEWSVERQPEEWLDLRWTERGGPPVRTPSRTGFGSQMLQGCARSAGGRIELSWPRDGLRVRLRMPLARTEPQRPGLAAEGRP